MLLKYIQFLLRHKRKGILKAVFSFFFFMGRRHIPCYGYIYWPGKGVSCTHIFFISSIVFSNLWSLNFKVFKIYFYFYCVCVYITCVQLPMGARKRCWIFENWCYRRLWVLGAKLLSSRRTEEYHTPLPTEPFFQPQS